MSIATKMSVRRSSNAIALRSPEALATYIFSENMQKSTTHSCKPGRNRRGPGGPHHSQPGGRRYGFLRGGSVTAAGDSKRKKRCVKINALLPSPAVWAASTFTLDAILWLWGNFYRIDSRNNSHKKGEGVPRLHVDLASLELPIFTTLLIYIRCTLTSMGCPASIFLFLPQKSSMGRRSGFISRGSAAFVRGKQASLHLFLSDPAAHWLTPSRFSRLYVKAGFSPPRLMLKLPY